MTFHLEGPWLSSISTRKRAEKITKSQREELERNWRDRNKRLKELGLSKQTFEEFLDFVNGRKTEKTSNNRELEIKQSRRKITFALDAGMPNLSYRTQTKTVISNIATGDNYGSTSQNQNVTKVPLEITRPEIWVTGPTSSKPTPTYTGSKVVGIAQMAKSNAVPVFNNDEIIDIARMRR